MVFFFLNQMSWGVKIEGSREKITQALTDSLATYELTHASFLKNQNEIEALQQQILLDFQDEIDWLNLYLDGHVYILHYTPKTQSQVPSPSYAVLVASDDAVIDRIDVSKGNVLVKKNQYVRKGQVLVSNEIMATDDTVKLIETKGKIYGYTYKTLTATMEGTDLAEHFTFLHFQLLQAIADEIGEDGYITQENVLQYELKEGKITLKVQFTLYKNIAQKEIINEQ